MDRAMMWEKNRIGRGFIFWYSPEWVEMSAEESHKRVGHGFLHHVLAYDRQYCLFDPVETK